MISLHTQDGWAQYCEKKLFSYSDSKKLSGRLQSKREHVNKRIGGVLEWINLGNIDEKCKLQVSLFYKALKSCKVMEGQNLNSKGGSSLLRCLESAIQSRNNDQVSEFVKSWPGLITESAFRLAIQHDSPEVVRMIPWNKKKSCEYALLWACYKGDQQTVYDLLDKKVDIHCVVEGKTPLEVAADNGQLEMVLFLMEYDVLDTDRDLHPVLSKASQNGWEAVAEQIISKISGDDVKIKMELYCQYNLEEQAFALLHKGVDVSEKAFEHALTQNMDKFVTIVVQGLPKYPYRKYASFNDTLFQYLLIAYKLNKQKIAKEILAHDSNPFSGSHDTALLSCVNNNTTWIIKDWLSKSYLNEKIKALKERPYGIRRYVADGVNIFPAIMEWCEENKVKLPPSSWIVSALYSNEATLERFLSRIEPTEVAELVKNSRLFAHNTWQTRLLLNAGAELYGTASENLITILRVKLFDQVPMYLEKCTEEDLRKNMSHFNHISIVESMIKEKKMDVVVAYVNALSPLLDSTERAHLMKVAASLGASNVVKELLRALHGTGDLIELIYSTQPQHSPFHSALSNGHSELARQLWSHLEGDLDAFFEKIADQFLIEIVDAGDDKIAYTIFEKMPESIKTKQLVAKDEDGNTLLMLAIRKGFDFFAAQLLPFVTNLECRNNEGQTAFSLAHEAADEKMKLAIFKQALSVYKDLPIDQLIQKIDPFGSLFGMETYAERSLTDYTITVKNDSSSDTFEGKNFRVNLALMAAKSSYFKAIQNEDSPFQEKKDRMCIIRDQIEPQVMEQLLGYMYGRELVVTYDNFKQLLYFSRMYMLSELEEMLTRWVYQRPECRNWLA